MSLTIYFNGQYWCGLIEYSDEKDNAVKKEWNISSYVNEFLVKNIDEKIMKKFNVEILNIQIIETIQLLSMISLHKDNPEFQIIVFLKAVIMMWKCISLDTSPLLSSYKIKIDRRL